MKIKITFTDLETEPSWNVHANGLFSNFGLEYVSCDADWIIYDQVKDLNEITQYLLTNHPTVSIEVLP